MVDMWVEASLAPRFWVRAGGRHRDESTPPRQGPRGFDFRVCAGYVSRFRHVPRGALARATGGLPLHTIFRHFIAPLSALCFCVSENASRYSGS